MRSRGQAALDLLLALVILLVVLASMGGILSSFTDTQKEISLHQQLDEQARVSALFLSSYSRFMHEDIDPPPSFIATLNEYTRVEGGLPLSSIRVSGYPQGVDCSISLDWTSGVISFFTSPYTAGLEGAVSASRSFLAVPSFDLHHDVESPGCGSPISVEAS
jgi:hypothetical protein